jgi:hypothetical protein
LQITSDSQAVQMLYIEEGSYRRTRLTVRYSASDPYQPDYQGSDRARWLALAIQRELRINPLPDAYEAAAAAAPTGVEGLQYGTQRQAAAPAVDLYHPTGGGTVMRLAQCGIWHRNEAQVIMACVCSLGVFAALLPDRRGRLNPPSILFFGVIAAVAWFYVVWRRWSTTLIRAKEGVITIYRRSPLGLQKMAVLTTANARELLVRDGTRVVAKNASGRDVPLFVEDDASTQEAAIRFIRETLWPGQIAPEGPSGRDLPPRAQPQRSLTAPAGFTVHDGGWELAVPGDFAALIRGILFPAVLAAALCWPLLHFHPWGIVWADVTSILIGAGAALLISDGILAWLHPTRLEFDGDTLARVSSGLTGTQRLAWNRWQIKGLQIVHDRVGRHPRAGIRLRFTDGRSKALLRRVPEESLRRIAAFIAESMSLDPQVNRRMQTSYH